MEKIKSCGVLIFRNEPELSFLLMKHADRYDLPKGHVDGEETDIQCALREMTEETGLAATDVELDPTFRFSHQYTVRYERTGNREMEKTLVIFLGRLLRDIAIKTTEHPDYQWVAWNPPHQIQKNTIDPLLEQVAQHFASQEGGVG